MTLRFLSGQTGAVASDAGLLELLSEFIDANADTVDLMTGKHRTELEWSAHCDYLRALQRLGHETLACHDRRMPALPLALAVVSELKSALTRGWTAALPVFRSPARAAQTLHPLQSTNGECTLARVELSCGATYGTRLSSGGYGERCGALRRLVSAPLD